MEVINEEAIEPILIWKKNALMGSVKECEVPNAPNGDDQVDEMPDTDDDMDGERAPEFEQPPVVIDADAV